MVGLNGVPNEVLASVFEAIDFRSLARLGAIAQGGAARVARNRLAEDKGRVLHWARDRLDQMAAIFTRVNTASCDADNRTSGDLVAAIQDLMATRADDENVSYSVDVDDYGDGEFLLVNLTTTLMEPQAPGFLELHVWTTVRKTETGWERGNWLYVSFLTMAFILHFQLTGAADWRVNPVLDGDQCTAEFSQPNPEQHTDPNSVPDDSFMPRGRLVGLVDVLLSPAFAEIADKALHSPIL